MQLRLSMIGLAIIVTSCDIMWQMSSDAMMHATACDVMWQYSGTYAMWGVKHWVKHLDTQLSTSDNMCRVTMMYSGMLVLIVQIDRHFVQIPPYQKTSLGRAESNQNGGLATQD